MIFFTSILIEGTMLSSINFKGEILLEFLILYFTLCVRQVLVGTLYSVELLSYDMLSLGILTLTATNPIWVVKTRLCLSDTASVPIHRHYSGLRNGLYKLYHYEGVRGLYRGFIPGLWGTSHGATQFMFYEELKRLYTVHNSISIDAKLVCMQLCGQIHYYNLHAFGCVRQLLCTFLWLPQAKYAQCV